MKTTYNTLLATLLLLLLLLLVNSCSIIGTLNYKSIKGDGNVITKQIDVSTFDRVKLANVMSADYTQVKGDSKLTVKVDQNIFDIYTFNVEDRVLHIVPKEHGVGVQPTHFHITVQSESLIAIDIVGGTNLNLIGAITSDALNLEIAGSGSINAKAQLNIGELDINLAGSTRVNIEMLQARSLNINIAGSGSAEFSGVADQADYNIAGSGKITSINLKTLKTKMDIAGSGSAYIFAVEKLDIDIAGSGSVYYKGSPKITTDIAGSGSIKQI